MGSRASERVSEDEYTRIKEEGGGPSKEGQNEVTGPPDHVAHLIEILITAAPVGQWGDHPADRPIVSPV